ncbi:hypothetical protein V8C44DRAFT_68288 [Trichoderma aethiopicum]
MRRHLGDSDEEFGFIPNDNPVVDLVVDEDAMSMMAMSAIQSQTTHAQFRLGPEVKGWHVCRQSMMTQILYGITQAWGPSWSPVPMHVGAVYKDPKSETNVEAWWVHDFPQKRLYIAKLSMKRQEGLEIPLRLVLRAAVHEAMWFNLREIVAWDPNPRLVAQAERLVKDLGQNMTATLENRSEMVPCFRWHGGEDKDVVWRDGEYWTWC